MCFAFFLSLASRTAGRQIGWLSVCGGGSITTRRDDALLTLNGASEATVSPPDSTTEDDLKSLHHTPPASVALLCGFSYIFAPLPFIFGPKAHVWNQRGAEAGAEVKQLAYDVMNIGRLVSFNWKLGLSTESSMAKGLGK